ncbi:hypothetical protein SPONL_1230 [uncultured Candidatus Thioglobus sp.]|nr:hypothetical protein SPONL_1230 [uncultured Candidatus Thioglobus sp.]
MELQFKQINTQGQISVGKQLAGQKMQVKKYPDGSVLLTPIKIMTTFEFNLMQDEMFQKRMVEFQKWATDNQPRQTDIDKLDLRQTL